MKIRMDVLELVQVLADDEQVIELIVNDLKIFHLLTGLWIEDRKAQL